MATLFISDLHLSGERPATLELFRSFLAGPAREADALYILGDLFEVWLGDDLILPEYQPILEAMKALSEAGVPLYVMHGNRDFLLGERFAALTGATLLDDPTRIDLDGTPTLLMHGDLLCTDDLPYQQMRKQLRDPAFIEDFLAKTPEARIAFARELRERSRDETGSKAEYIMDVNAEAVTQRLHEQGVRRLIHGHTHRPGRHALALAEGPAERIVLGDWDASGSVLHCDAEGCRLETLKA